MDILPVYKAIGNYANFFKDLDAFENELLSSSVITNWIDGKSETSKKYVKDTILKEIAQIDASQIALGLC